MSSLDYLDLCRLCLVKDRVSVPIFEGEGDVRQIFLKIAACLPVKVGREDKLPKKICDDCVYKVELFYQFWNTTANAEKQLLQWLGEVSMDDKQGYVTGAHDPSMMKPGQNTGENRLDGSSVMQQVNEHTNNMGMGMMDGMGIGMPMMIPNSGQQPQQQQMTSVPMDTGGNAVQNVQPVPGPSAQIGQQKINAPTNEDEDEDESEEEDNSDDECDGDDGLPVKEESEDEPNRTIEPTTFVNVSLACDEAGPSGLQQQKIGEMPEMVMPPTDGDPKSGNSGSKAPSVAEIVITPRIFSYSGAREKLSKHGSDKSVRKRKRSASEDDRRKGRSRENSRREDRRRRSTKTRKENDLGESKSDGGAALKCDHCRKKFGSKSTLIVHLKQHRYHCDQCPKAFTLVRHLDAHVEKVHRIQYYKCTVCDYESHNRSTLKTHFIRLHTSNYEFECDTCGKQFKIRKALNQHVKLYHLDAPPIVCDVCGHFSKNLHALKAHLRYRHYKPEFVCKICNRGMVTKENLEQHIDWHKTREKVLCPTCGKKFRSRDLESHMRVHTGIKPFACPVCGKNFRRQTAQEQHIVIHTGQRPYVCDICGQAFAQKPGLICHRKKHPGPLPPPPVTSIKNIITEFLQEYATGQFSK